MASSYWSKTLPNQPDIVPPRMPSTRSIRASQQTPSSQPDRPPQHTPSPSTSSYHESVDEVTDRYSRISLTTVDSNDVLPPMTPPDYTSEVLSHRLVIAMDYGTTFTGVAFAMTRSDIAKLKEIEVVDDWGSKMQSLQKIPSVISYSPGSTAERNFGEDIGPKAVTMVNTKMELEVQDKKVDELELTLQVLEGTQCLSFENVKKAGGHPAYTWKTPERIITDYLTKVYEYLFGTPNPYGKSLQHQYPVDIVITVPVKWSYAAQHSTFKAIKTAGFNEDNFPQMNDVIVISEPEAASIFTARYLKEDRSTQFLRAKECFVLCDAGGGTVDVVSYQVTRLEPLELKKIGYATSEKCGAAYINAEFKTWLKSIIGERNYRQLDPQSAGERIGSHTTEGAHLRSLLKDFEKKKKSFSNRSSAMKLDLPGTLAQLNVPPRVIQGELTINPDDMRKIFDTCVNKVVTLIKGQIQQVESEHRRVRNVFLVGGFGESPYLQEELKQSMEMKSITIRRPDMNMSWTAVVRGAVIYAIVIDEPYSSRKFNHTDRYTDPTTNNAMAKKQIIWMIRKGDLILSEENKVSEKGFTFTFGPNANQKFDLPIYVYPEGDDDDVPDRWENGQHDIEEIGRIVCDLSRFSTNDFDQRRNPHTDQIYYLAYVVCKMQLSMTHLEVKVWVTGTVVGQTRIATAATDPTQRHESDRARRRFS